MQNVTSGIFVIFLTGLLSCPVTAKVIQHPINSITANSEISSVEPADFIPLLEFGDNPGELKASYYSDTSSGHQAGLLNSKLIVLLHGCGQNGEALSRQTGLLQLVKHHQFSLLIPQQLSSNNATACFNWFSKKDQSAGEGEALSIMNMISTVQNREKLKQVYLIGLSAGGAMASNLLSQYPEHFEAGAVIAGIPFPCADNLVKAISCMKSGSDIAPEQQANKVIDINGEVKNWPRITIITGTSDGIVSPKNSMNMAKQWSYLHQVAGKKEVQKSKGRLTTWWGDGKDVELIELEKIGHGFPVDPNVKDGGTVAPFVVGSDMSAAKYLLDKWVN